MADRGNKRPREPSPPGLRAVYEPRTVRMTLTTGEDIDGDQISDEGIEILKSLLAQTTDQTNAKTTDQTNAKPTDQTITKRKTTDQTMFNAKTTDQTMDAKTTDQTMNATTTDQTMTNAKTTEDQTQLESITTQCLYDMLE